MESMVATPNIDTQKKLRDVSPLYFWNVRITIDIVSLKEGKVRQGWQDHIPSQRLLLHRDNLSSKDKLRTVKSNAATIDSVKEGSIRHEWQDHIPSQRLLLPRDQLILRDEYSMAKNVATST